ncbi:zinc finger protein 91 [Drosophila pseudoobscura]|uniref:Zinc finger protein 91 n=1 Tax=Drosophila pseudoobscura pseudoobscura TaxID=46245 RepID=A0A6I8V753_DROPS|nr:zinc finger protein 91 [Drosophila pseudoobscura]
MRNKICRICGGHEASINLFCPKNGHLIRQILSITGVGLNEKAGLSSHMCDKCVFDLDCAIKFRQRCIISEKRNLEKVNSEPKDEEDAESDKESNELNTDEEISDDCALEYESEKCTETSMKRKHSKYAEPYICDDCGKTINSWSNFQEHKLRHTGVKNFECQFSECGKRFATRKELVRHQRCHTGEKPFVCSYCSRRFSDASSREEHHRRHRNEKRFECKTCGKSFVSSGCLRKHVLTHASADERKYLCGVCNKRFLRIAHLQNHLTTTTHLEKALEASQTVVHENNPSITSIP